MARLGLAQTGSARPGIRLWARPGTSLPGPDPTKSGLVHPLTGPDPRTYGAGPVWTQVWEGQDGTPDNLGLAALNAYELTGILVLHNSLELQHTLPFFLGGLASQSLVLQHVYPSFSDLV